MANHCWNTINIIGNPKDLYELHHRIKSYIDNVQSHYWGGSYYTMFRTMHPFYRETEIYDDKFDVYHEYGSKWFDISDISLDNDHLTISGTSAWSPMTSLCSKLAIDYNLYIELEFEEPGMDMAGIYTYENTGQTDAKNFTMREYNYLFNRDAYFDDLQYLMEETYLSKEEFYKEEKGFLDKLKLNKDYGTIKKIEEMVKEIYDVSHKEK